MSGPTRPFRALAASLGAVTVLTSLALTEGAAAAVARPSSAPAADLPAPAPSLSRLEYNNPGLTVDLGVGLWAWPLPMDVDGDGVHDLLVNSPDKPFNGLWYFHNTGTNEDPLFAEPTRLSRGMQNTHISSAGGEVYVTTPNRVYPDVATTGLLAGVPIGFDGVVHEPDLPDGRLRGDQWNLVDFTGDGALDIVVGIGDWSEYGWDAAYDDEGTWTNGPLHGYVYLIENTGTTDSPVYADPVKIEAGGAPIDVFGAPTPVVDDFTGDGDLDLITGEFLDTPLFFENAGTRTAPSYEQGRPIPLVGGGELTMDLEMIIVTAIDWDLDGHVDLVIGEEDGRVSLVRNSGTVQDGVPVFEAPVYFQQEAQYVKVGALATPSAVDWDGDGLQDLIVGDTAGRISLVRNLGGDGPTPTWAAPARLSAGGEEIRHQAGYNGSVQGPAEAKWGYTSPTAADWNGDGLPDILVNDIWGKVVWYQNVGTRTAPELAPAQPIEVAWDGPAPKPTWNWWDPEGDELVTQWRTTPVVRDIDGDGLVDLVIPDHEGYLAFYKRVATDDGPALLPGERIFIGEAGSSIFDADRGNVVDGPEGPILMNASVNGASGRRKLDLADWTGDGRLDIIINGTNAQLLENVGTDADPWRFRLVGDISNGELAGHTTSPTTVNWDGGEHSDLLIGGEDGHLYYQPWNGDHVGSERWGEPPAEIDDLVGSWALDERGGHVATDSSGYGNHGVVDGATRIPGHTGSGLLLDAFNDYVDLSYTVAPYLADASGVTFESWVKVDSLDTGTQRLFGTRIDGGRAGFEVTFENANARARISVAGRSTSRDGYRKLLFDASTIRPGQWHHVAAVMDVANDAMRLYVDGVERGAVSDNGVRFGSDVYVVGTPSEPDSLGRSPNGTGYVRGAIDDTSVYRVARDQRDVIVDVLTAGSARAVEQDDLEPPLAHPLRRHLETAAARLAAGDLTRAREQVAAAHELLTGPRGDRHVTPEVREQLLALTREYLWRADPPAQPGECPAPGNAATATWRSAPAAPRLSNEVAQAGFADQTLRMVARAGAGGCAVQVRLSNEFGTGDVAFDAVSVARHDDGGRLVPDTSHPVTFGGTASVVVPPGEEVVSDPVPLPVGDRQELAVSMYLAGATGPATTHNLARENGYVAAGDHVADPDATAFRPLSQAWMFLSGIDVVAPPSAPARPGAVVAVGDSLTDGLGSAIGAEKTWPDLLTDRLLEEAPGSGLTVVNRGVSAGRLLRDAPPSEPNPGSLPGGLARLDRDLAGASTVILYLGINDIIQSRLVPAEAVTAADLIDGYREYLRRAHEQGVRVVGATLTPYGGSRNFTAGGEAIRQEVNAWIRTSGEFDAVADLDAAVRDGADPARIDPRYDLGDHLHFQDAGYRAISAAIDLTALTG